MLDGLIGGLFTAWLLTIFNIDKMFVEALQPLMSNVILTSSHYYMVFGLIGLIGGAFGK